MERVLIIEDDEAMAFALRDGFEYEGYSVLVASEGDVGLRLASEKDLSLILLDVMLPNMSGIDICKRIRSEGNDVPIIMLTARGQEIDKVLGLKCGADDYITKPFSLRELEARIKSVLRRVRAATKSDGTSEESLIVHGRLRIDPAKREVNVGERQVELTPKEFELLRLFATNPGRVFPRKYLLEKIWDYSYEGYDRTIDSHINRLRAKIEDNPDNPQLVLTVWGIGYKFSDER